MNRKANLRLCASILALGLTTSIHAQEGSVAGATEADTPAVGEIIVTAQKREQSLQAVPAAVSVVSQEGLVSGGIMDQSQLTKLVPGLTIGRQSTTGFAFIRGVGQTLGSPNLQPAVSVNINGVPLPREAGLTPLFDMARVEVLPGPQGTLWGRNSAGGAINFVTEQPGNDREFHLSLGYGNYNQIKVDAAANIPLGSNAALRVAAEQLKNDPWSKSGLGDNNSRAIRTALNLDPSDQLHVMLFGEYGLCCIMNILDSHEESDVIGGRDAQTHATEVSHDQLVRI